MSNESYVFDFGMKWFYLEDWENAVAEAHSRNNVVYCWKSIGVSNWLEKGLSISDVLCLVTLPKGISDYIDLPDDENEND